MLIMFIMLLQFRNRLYLEANFKMVWDWLSFCGFI